MTCYNTFCYMCNVPPAVPTRFQCDKNNTSTFHEDVEPVYDLVFEPEPITDMELSHRQISYTVSQRSGRAEKEVSTETTSGASGR